MTEILRIKRSGAPDLQPPCATASWSRPPLTTSLVPIRASISYLRLLIPVVWISMSRIHGMVGNRTPMPCDEERLQLAYALRLPRPLRRRGPLCSGVARPAARAGSRTTAEKAVSASLAGSA
eukprot:649618-Pleurochrysis_carterae.AAC.4